MGNTPGGAAAPGVHASQSLQQQLQTIEVEKTADERLGLNLKSLVVCDCEAGGAAERAGCQAMVGMRLLSVDGRAIASGADVVTESKGKTQLALVFAPRELPLTIECKTGEAHGLTLSPTGMMMGSVDGPAKRAGADQFMGLCIVSVDGQTVRTGPDAEAALADAMQHGVDGAVSIVVGFGLPLPEAPQNAATVLPDGNLQEQVQRAKAEVAADPRYSASDLELRHVAIEGSAREARELFITSPNRWQHCGGLYCLCPGDLANGWPVWAKDPYVHLPQSQPGSRGSQDRWLYSTPNGYWRVTDSKDDFGKGAGFLISRDKHQGRLPSDMQMWQTKGYEDDPDVRVSNAPTPAQRKAYAAVHDRAEPAGGLTRRVSADSLRGESGVPRPQELQQGDKVRLLRTLGVDGMAQQLLKGSEATVVGVRKDGRVELRDTATGSLHAADPSHLWREAAGESVLVREAGAGIGLRFTGSNCLLRGVVGGSVADKFGAARFTGRRLESVGSAGGDEMVSVRTPAELSAAVAPLSGAILLQFAPDPSEEMVRGDGVLTDEAPFATVLSESERAGRASVDAMQTACRMPMAQRLLCLSCRGADAARAEWKVADESLRGATQKAVGDGGGVAGAQDAVSSHAQRLRGLVEACSQALRQAKAAEGAGAVVSHQQRSLLVQLTAAVEAEEAERPRADVLVSDYRETQERIDAADDALYRTKRQLSRRPGDAALQSRQEEEQLELQRAEAALSEVIRAMRLLAPSQPQLLAYVLTHPEHGTPPVQPQSPPPPTSPPPASQPTPQQPSVPESTDAAEAPEPEPPQPAAAPAPEAEPEAAADAAPSDAKSDEQAEPSERSRPDPDVQAAEAPLPQSPAGGDDEGGETV